jgi:hypothetical protein
VNFIHGFCREFHLRSKFHSQSEFHPPVVDFIHGFAVDYSSVSFADTFPFKGRRGTASLEQNDKDSQNSNSEQSSREF